MFVFACSVIASCWDPLSGRLFSMFSYGMRVIKIWKGHREFGNPTLRRCLCEVNIVCHDG